MEFNDFYKFNIEEIDYGIEYYFSNNLKDNLELLNHKYPNKVFKVYSKETFAENKNDISKQTSHYCNYSTPPFPPKKREFPRVNVIFEKNYHLQLLRFCV